MRLRSTEPVEDAYIGLPPGYEGGETEEPASAEIDIDPLIAVIHAPHERLAEQARDIQSTLSALRRPDGSPPGSIAIIAIDAIEQAAILTANIAVSAALSGVRTLIVDMEDSGFVQHRLLNMSPRPIAAEDMDNPFSAVQSSHIRSLFVIAAPQPEGASADGSPLGPLAERLSSLTAHFDLCLVDASHVEDIAHAAASADCAIVAVQRDQTSTTELKAVINKMTMLNTTLIGTIMLI